MAIEHGNDARLRLANGILREIDARGLKHQICAANVAVRICCQSVDRLSVIHDGGENIVLENFLLVIAEGIFCAIGVRGLRRCRAPGHDTREDYEQNFREILQEF